MVLKVCTECKEEKEISNFHIKKSSSDGHKSKCKKCISVLSKEYYLDNKNNILKKCKTYKNNNKEKCKISRKTYYNNNKEKCKEVDRLYYKENKENKRITRNEYRKNNREKVRLQEKALKDKNPTYRLGCSVRTLIGNSISKKGYRKNSKTANILGVSIPEFKIYLESQFKQGMSWENRGDWHIDHIIPISFAENEEEVIMLNHYTNLRPLWKVENLSKNDNILEKTDLYHEILKNRLLTIK